MAMFPRRMNYGTSGQGNPGGGPISAGPPPSSLPAGVQLVGIDGTTIVSGVQTNYYSGNSFSNAAAAGFDDTLYPIIAWFPGISPTGAPWPAGIQRVKNFADTGVSVIGQLFPPITDPPPQNNNDPNSLTYLGTSGVGMGVSSPVYLIQGITGGARLDGANYWMVNSGTETVGYITCDEPGYWNFASDPTFYDVVNAAAGTWISSLTIPALWQSNKFQWINWEGQLMSSPYSTFAAHFPALDATVENFFTRGANWPSTPMTPTEMLYTQIANRDGFLRRIDVTGADIYWFSTQPTSTIEDGIAGGLATAFGIWDIGLNGIAIPGSFTSAVGTTIGVISVPAGSMPTTLLETHASDPNHQGLACMSASRTATISNATWAATSGGQATFTTTAAHGYLVGQTNIQVFGVNPAIGVNSASWSGGNATLVTASAHGLVVGLSIDVSGVPTFPGYNGTAFTTLAGTAGTNIVYAVANPGGSAGSGGSVQSHIQYNNVSFPYYTALAGTTGSTLVVALPASSPGPGNYVSGGSIQALANMACPVTAYTPGSPGSMTLGASTKLKSSDSLNGSFSNWAIGSFTMSPDQQFRGCHYGAMIDAIRAYQSHAHSNQTPLWGSVENYNQSPGGGWRAPTPAQITAASWGNVIHGARGFYTIAGDTINTSPGLGGTYYTIQAPNKISIYDCLKSTHYLINTLARVINSPFAEGTLLAGYVHVTGDNAGGSTLGARAPWRPLDHGVMPNQNNSYPFTGGPGTNTYNFNPSFASQFEVMAKWYTGPAILAANNNGVALVPNKFWIFCDYRGSAQDGINGVNANTLTATFTIANTGSTSVDRFYCNSVLGAASNGAGGTTITCGETQQIATNDSVVISGASGVAGLNGTFSVLSTNRTRTTFDIPLAFSGALLPAIIDATWAATSGGQATFTTVIPHGIGVGVTGLVVAGINPSGFNGTYTTLAGTTGSTIVVTLVSNPGAFVSGGNGTGFAAFIAIHNIPVTGGGTTFQDTFPRGDCIGIYRVN